MKFNINPPTGRKEYVNLPEREPDNAAVRDFLGAKMDHAAQEEHVPFVDQNLADDHDILSDFLSDNEPSEIETDASVEKESSWRHTKWSGMLFLAALLVLGSIWFLASRAENDLPLSRIKVEGATLLSDKEVISLAAIDRTVPFYKIDLKPIELRLLRHSFVRNAHVRRELNPETLVITIEERQPIAMLRSDSTGEAFIVDRDGMLLRPKLIAGLRDPARLMQVPLLSGVNERDTAGFRAMSRMVANIALLDSGAMRNAIGELRRTPTGDFVIYTTETQTPIFIGSPFEHEFRTAIEEQTATAPKNTEPLFTRQLALLASVWKSKLETELRHGGALYIDARFSGQIILKHKTPSASQIATEKKPAAPVS
jgi:cell division septal protein FtsQ